MTRQVFEGAFIGVDILNIISYPSFVVDHRIKVHKRAIDAAVKQGVKTIVYSSLAFAGDGNTKSKATVMQAHLSTERYLAKLSEEDPSFSYLIVRQGLYSESAALMYLGHLDPKSPPDQVLIPHDGKRAGVAWAKRQELGEATANIIVELSKDPSSLSNKNILLSGPKSLSLQETADVIGNVIGKDLPIKQVSVEEYATRPEVDQGLAGQGREWANAWDSIRDGETDVVTPHLQHYLGRQPESFEATTRAMLA